MRWSLRIARIRGIDLQVHVSFLLILIFGAVQFREFGPAGMAFGVAMMLLLFVCVTLHEFGHSVVAQRFGIPVKRIVLLPIGGVAMMGRIPERPGQELLIAIAGPLVNVAIAAVLWTAIRLAIGIGGFDLAALLSSRRPSLGLALTWLLSVNVVLVLFNMIPAFPLDGGRVFRAILAYFLPWMRATRIAAVTGQILAVGLGMWGLMPPMNPFLVLIALFVFMGAGAEAAETHARAVLSTLRVGDAYNNYAFTLREDDRVSTVVDHLLTSYQPDYAVLRGGEAVGIVSRENVLQSLGKDHDDPPVAKIMQSPVFQVESRSTLEEVNRQLTENERRVAAVYDGDVFLGLVSTDDIAEAGVILSFLRRQQQGELPPPKVVETA